MTTLFTNYADPDERGCLRADPSTPPTRKEVFEFLEFLRTTGKTNMLGAAKYIEHYLDVPPKEAKEHLWAWIDHPNRVKRLAKLITGVEK